MREGGFFSQKHSSVWFPSAFSKISQVEIPAKAPPSERTKTQRASSSGTIQPWPLKRNAHTRAQPATDCSHSDMDVHRVSNHGQMDYNFDNMGPKQGKVLPCQEDRFDSGLDSLKEELELVSEFEVMSVDQRDHSHESEPWRSAVTEDGDT